MKWLGTKRVALKSIVLPGNFSATRAAPRITELATSIREHGTIEPPVVEAKTHKLVVGHDRVAALLSLKEEQIEVRLVEGTATELRRMQIAENLHRRQDDRTSLIAEYARAEETEIARPEPAKSGHVSRPTQSVKKEANAAVAAAAGIRPASVTKAKQRARQREERTEQAASSGPEKEEQSPALPLPAGFVDYGLAVPRELAEGISAAHAWLSQIEGDARRIVGEITKLGNAGRPVAHAHLEAMRVQAKALGHAIREAIPAALCPYCKAQAALVTNCNGCGATGVVGRHAGDHVPRELLGTEPVTVAVNGHIVPLADAAAALKELPEPKKKGGKPIHVEVIDEVGAEPRELTLERTAAEESEELF